ncbi:CrcB family protein [Corynebacterium sp.]|uniref:CrcB family protein n=1 Tax=Corynebacterium sp. TaxID=1720 RepID=UPI0026DB8C12|nr:CrcB family protein [Corynebacterium sp.]MDO5076250.1 CrcB family protein [Corynebacterium sp.]
MTDMLRVSAGAVLGAAARHAATTLLPNLWALCAVNILGCWLMGRYRPGMFWGSGVLGGFTSFSGFELLVLGQPLYLVPTVVGCVGAFYLGDRTWHRS